MLFRARKFLDDDMAQIMLAVLTALQDERDRAVAAAAEAGAEAGAGAEPG